MNQQGPLVETRELTKQYGEFTALDALSISVEHGQILGFIGPNGAGKTTTIRILVGLLRPTSGRATIAGVDCVRNARQLKRLVGYMPDMFGSYDNMRVREYLDFFGAAFGMLGKKRKRRIEEVLETTGSTYMKDQFVETLSHGMQQRIALSRTLLHDPQVLILDEPAHGLDPHARIEMRELLLRLADEGKTLIVTSHILPELARVCSVVAILTSGKLCAFGTLDEIMKKINQRRSFEVQLVDGGKLADARRVIGEALSMDPEKEVSGSEAEGLVWFDTDRSDEDLAGLLARIIDRGISVSQFREMTTDLEDAFLSVTRSDESGSTNGNQMTPPETLASAREAP
ncbi:MAG: ABC transporter ATP-binding protein [Pirellulaceae bacterium]